MPLHVKNYRFAAKWYLVLLTFAFMALFINLGCWQLARGKEKAVLQATYQTRLHQPPAPLQQLLPQLKNPDDWRYSPVTVTGHYDNAHTMLLDNKIYQHQVGYEVLTPFVPNNGSQHLLVNRGWIAADKNRQVLPTIPAITGTHQITGFIYVTPGKAFTLGNVTETSAWPLRLQALDIPALQEALQQSLYPFVLLLAPSDASSDLVRDWQPTVMSPSKHQGYAVQWFTFAGVLLIIFVALSFRKTK